MIMILEAFIQVNIRLSYIMQNFEKILYHKYLGGLDFDYESDKIPTTPDASLYETCYVTSHKAPCRAAAFDHQGTVIATGSVDASIKILDVER